MLETESDKDTFSVYCNICYDDFKDNYDTAITTTNKSMGFDLIATQFCNRNYFVSLVLYDMTNHPVSIQHCYNQLCYFIIGSYF